MLFHAARQKGITAIGPNAVPSLASSKEKGRQAIEMLLLLRSLEQSKYGSETWNLRQTSRERLTAAPEYCFKKGAIHIDVQFDDDPENTVEYVSWEEIYYQDDEGEWQKVLGEIDVEGLFYTQVDGLTVYYVNFADEAKRFSNTGKWSLVYNNKFLASITSLDPQAESGSSSERSVDSSPRRQPRRSVRPRNSTPVSGRSETSPSPKRTERRGRTELPVSIVSPISIHPTTSRGGGGRRSRSRSPARPSTSSGQSGGRRGGDPRQSSRRDTPPAPSAAEVGTVRTSTPQRPGGRLSRLLREAWDPPGLLIKGPPNAVKCYRYTLKSKYSDLFRAVSTTWHWTARDSVERLGNARMLVLFDDNIERRRFQSRVKLPRTLESFDVQLGGV